MMDNNTYPLLGKGAERPLPRDEAQGPFRKTKRENA
jgi:hypothetical protein